jgi:3-oxoacyl-[acyl-carrier protein] reductase
MSLSGKVALITGANRGIGKAIAVALGKQGATIVGVTNIPEGIEEINAFCKELGFKGQGFLMDVSDVNSVDQVVEEITKIYGAPTILVNNAGIARDNLMLRMKVDEWQAVLDTNLNSVFYLSRACLKGMVKARWGRIINMASVVGVTGNPGQANYTAAKAGVIAFTKTLAMEVGSRNITVNAIAPGFIETSMTQKLTQEQRDAYLNTVPLKRVGQPEDIAKATAFLVSDDASYITGITLHVNGGMYMA